MIWRIILGGLWKPILAALAVLGLYANGRADARTTQKLDRLKADNDAHERITHADVSRGSVDADTDWLRRRSGD